MSQKYEIIIKRIQEGSSVELKEGGNSMTPIIAHREPVTLSPVDTSKLEKGDIVLAKVRGNYYTHLVSAIEGERVQISNNHGKVNGWIHRSKVYAIVSAISGVPRKSAVRKIKKEYK